MRLLPVCVRPMYDIAREAMRIRAHFLGPIYRREETESSHSLLRCQADNMDNQDNRQETHFLVAGIMFLAAAYFLQKRRHRRPPQDAQQQRRPRRVWCRSWLTRRSLHGDFDSLLQELNREDGKAYKNYLRMRPELFEEMVDRLTPLLNKKSTRMRDPLSVGLKLAVTLRFLASGDSYTSLQYSFRVSKSAISRFIPKVCQAIIAIYKPIVMKCPRTPEQWNEVAEGFSKRWNYFNCGGALDGKHVRMKKPSHGGSLFFNYKKFHSLILLALADSSYKFLYVDIGAEGGAGDGATWYKCSLHEAIESQQAGFPDASCLPDDNTPLPFHLIGDDAFALKKWLMKPYSHQSQVYEEKIFSYRLSRARRVVENAFGLLQQRFRVFGTTMQMRSSVVKLVTMCGCVLHNLLMERYPNIHPLHIDTEDDKHNVVPGSWREVPNLLQRLRMKRMPNATREAKTIRDYLALYYSSEAGKVPWQDRLLYPTGRPIGDERMEI